MQTVDHTKSHGPSGPRCVDRSGGPVSGPEKTGGTVSWSGHHERVDGDSGLVVVTAAERPDLWSTASDLFREVWPEYNHHGDFSDRYFGALIPTHAHLQTLVCDLESEQVVARGRTLPLRWDGTLADLPAGIDAAGLRAVSERAAPTALMALAAEVAAERHGRGVSTLVLEAMTEAARRARLAPLLAPVRPTWKDRYPLTPIERYATWTRADRLPFDPWVRVHARLGATTLRPEPCSMRISGPAADWERWTGMSFPRDGAYVFPRGLAPLHVESGQGRYWEPNVWMLHRV